MSFFKRHPRFWITIWSIFGLGGVVMAAQGLWDGFDTNQLVKGVISAAVAVIMIGYILKSGRIENA